MRVEYNTITFVKEKYDNEFEMWEDISMFMRMLMKNDKTCVVHDEDVVIVIEYEHDERVNPFGCCTPEWLTTDERDYLYDSRAIVNDDNGDDW